METTGEKRRASGGGRQGEGAGGARVDRAIVQTIESAASVTYLRRCRHVCYRQSIVGDLKKESVIVIKERECVSEKERESVCVYIIKSSDYISQNGAVI